MKILVLTNDGEGLYKFRKEVLIEFLKDNDVYISLPRDKYIEKLQLLGCRYIETKFNRKGMNPISDLKLMFFYKRIIKDVKPSVVLTYTIKPNVYGGLACQLCKAPYISNITGLGSSIENGGLLQIISLCLYKIGLKKVNKVFFQNTSNMEFMIERKIIKNDICELIPGSGVNTSEYKILEYPNGETIDFAYIGRIMKEKGFDQYITAAKYIREKYKNTRFHVAGEFEDDYKGIVEDLTSKNILIYHGSVINMVDEIYKIIQCTIHPTYYAEGMSNVLLESSACGRAIITTDRPGCREVVDDGINGFVIKQKDSDDLINKVEKFLSLTNMQRKQLGINGRKKVENEFDRNIVVDKYLKEVNKYK